MKTRFNFADGCLVAVVMLFTFVLDAIVDGRHNGWTTAVAVRIIGGLFVAGVLAYWWHVAKQSYEVTTYRAELNCVDIWAYQRHLMAVSDQKLPYLPEINKGALMYYALILEEAGELGEALVSILAASFKAQNAVGLHSVMTSIEQAQANMRYQSKKIRTLLEGVSDDWRTVPPLTLFKEVIDGAADVAVVTAGFSLAAGLPGREGFVEANRGNASKVNPVTGKIDKTPDGKWIKGVNYVAPNMMAILEQHVRAHREVLEQPDPFMG